jgi:hypothetical protein
MKQSLLLILGVSILLFGCSENALVPALDDPVQLEQDAYLKGAKKPAAKLVGDTYCMFTGPPPTWWNGTVDFGNGNVYGLTFISTGPPRDYSQASPFFEYWVIYYEGTDYDVPANVLMRGWNKGVVTFANKTPEPVNFHANGRVTEAYGPLEAWAGCTWHVKGLVHWIAPGQPEKAVGQVRIN